MFGVSSFQNTAAASLPLSLGDMHQEVAWAKSRVRSLCRIGRRCSCQPGVVEGVELGQGPVWLASGPCRHRGSCRTSSGPSFCTTLRTAAVPCAGPHLSVCPWPPSVSACLTPASFLQTCSSSVPKSQVHLFSAAQTKIKNSNPLSPPV